MVNFFVVNKPYTDIDSIYDVTNYILRDKRKQGFVMNRYSGGMGIKDIASAGDEFLHIKRYFGKSFGRQIKHFYITFEKKDRFTPQMAYNLGMLICQYYYCKFQIIFSVHEDTDHLHIHFALNTVSYKDGSKLHEGYEEYYAFRDYVYKCVEFIRKIESNLIIPTV